MPAQSDRHRWTGRSAISVPQQWCRDRPLSSLESQFTGTESSVQSMTAADQIKAADTQMGADRKEFMSTARGSLKEYNGTGKALRESVNASVMAQSADDPGSQKHVVDGPRDRPDG